MAADLVGSVFTNVLASLVLLAAGFLVGRYRERKRLQGRALTEYDFYPYVATPENFAERPVTAGFSSLANRPRMRSST